MASGPSPAFCRSALVRSRTRTTNPASASRGAAAATMLVCSTSNAARTIVTTDQRIVTSKITLPTPKPKNRGATILINVAIGLFRVVLNGVAMHLRPSELVSVAAGLGQFDSSEEGDLLTLA